MSEIDVLIPTLRRPENLTRALRSVFAQDRAAELMARIVVVDNSPEACAAAVVEALRPACPVALTYVHEGRPGVATARNAGLAASTSPLVAFLDDDEEAPPSWLGDLRRAHLALGSAVTFGPVRGVAADAHPDLRPYLEHFFSREGGSTDVLITDPFGCGNAMMTRAEALRGPGPFDTRADLTGGEDDRLFARLRREGLRFGWAADAWVYEYAPPHRARVGYALKRAFCYGQSPSQIRVRNRAWAALVLTMAIGSAQAVVYGSAAAALIVANRRSEAVVFADRAIRGLGKVLWPLKVRLYGLAASPTAASAKGSPGVAPPLLQT
ncbi:glycosyltransferase family 2 protein [Caulobacter sp. S45]|uniref:glycosyltransferase n=1 Tax=Caulobacter sp. S45 TaxID=1641861 RepID=UPI001574F521|nr:glycosyltransferase family 2 protein [Caulobacter sp. S45]